MKLFYRKIGYGGPVFILHGLFGSSDNWLGIAKVLADHYTVYLPDQRNHGRSPHSDVWNYEVMASEIEVLAREEELDQFCVLGHSMGGKVAMELAARHASMLKKIMVLDIGPKAYPIRHDGIIDGLKSIDLAGITKRKEANQQLAQYIPSIPVRQFLLKNLDRKNDGSFQWKINLEVIDRNISEVGKAQHFDKPVQNEVLFLKGELSDYILESDKDDILKSFPNATFETISAAGHWMHAEQPEAVMSAVRGYFNC